MLVFIYKLRGWDLERLSVLLRVIKVIVKLGLFDCGFFSIIVFRL